MQKNEMSLTPMNIIVDDDTSSKFELATITKLAVRGVRARSARISLSSFTYSYHS